jgi:serine/threonine-protein kinase
VPQAPAPTSILAPPPRPDFRGAAAAAAVAAPCSLLDAVAAEASVTVSGPLRRDGEEAVRRALAQRGVTGAAALLRLQPFDGPYCSALEVIRQVAAGPAEPPLVEILGRLPLQKGELLRLDVQLPDRAGHLYVSYLMKSGEIVHLVPSHPQPAGARVRLGEPRPGFPGWEIDEPYGTDMIIVFSSERPLFPEARPQIEPLDSFVPALTAALRNARTQGVRVSARAVVLETVERR